MQNNDQAIEAAQTAILTAFGQTVAADMNDKREAELLGLIKNVAANYHGYTTHWDIYVSGVSIFFYNFMSKLEVWSKDTVFVDRQVLLKVATAAMEFFVEWERKEARAHIYLNIAKRIEALGFYEEALNYYQKAYSHSHRDLNGWGIAKVKEELDKFLVLHPVVGAG